MGGEQCETKWRRESVNSGLHRAVRGSRVHQGKRWWCSGESWIDLLTWASSANSASTPGCHRVGVWCHHEVEGLNARDPKPMMSPSFLARDETRNAPRPAGSPECGMRLRLRLRVSE
jgi:hypothetical protein